MWPFSIAAEKYFDCAAPRYLEPGGVDTGALLGHLTDSTSDLFANSRGLEPIKVKISAAWYRHRPRALSPNARTPVSDATTGGLLTSRHHGWCPHGA